MGLIVGEIGLGLVYPQIYRSPGVWQHDPQLGWAHRPGSQGRLVSPEFDVAYRIGEAGLRDDDPSSTKGDRVTRVLLHGDSFAEGWGVGEEETLERHIERWATALTDGPVEVLNLGVAGYGTDQQLLQFSDLGKSLSPHLVVVLVYAHDLWNNASRRGIGAERGPKPYFRLGPKGLELHGVPVAGDAYWRRKNEQSVERFFSERSHLYSLMRKAWREQAAISPTGRQRFYAALYGNDDQSEYRPLWKLTEAIIAEFAQRVHAAGARFVLVYAPAIVQIEVDDWETKRELSQLTGAFDLLLPNRRLADFARAWKISFLDLYPAFRRAAKNGELLYYRDSHWTPRGHKLAAVELATFLDRHGYLTLGSPKGDTP
ncbi:MAG: SGNH/GDSL hydrolase family protein [Candidatus Latescibacterota bacterium]|nr:SGNH/GDSL hydrolase family protein [Candidatus Latescibacterota bacterium]